jgi:histidine ammonia-lyase
LITAAQAMMFRRPLKTSPYLEDFMHTFRAVVPFIEDDRMLYEDLRKAEQFLKNWEPK